MSDILAESVAFREPCGGPQKARVPLSRWRSHTACGFVEGCCEVDTV